MPLSIPAFDQYQQPLIPLRGLWNAAPREGDKYVNVEIDWLVTTKSTAVQFNLSGNSPVSLSQIVALYVDNGRSGSDVDFIFPDSGFVLTVAAHNQGLFPVLTNALMFYASAPNAAAGDVTIAQILNSQPPPIPIVASVTQNHGSTVGIPIQVNGSTPIIPAGINGTLNSLVVNVSAIEGATASASLALNDGAGHIVWAANVAFTGATANTITFPVPNLFLRFFNGLNFTVSGTTFTGGWVNVNAYYSTP